MCMHVQFSWGGIVTACLYCSVRERKGLLCVHRQIVDSVRMFNISSIFAQPFHNRYLLPVTGADWGGLFTRYRGSAEVLQKRSPESRKFPSVPVTSDCFFFLHIIFKIEIGTNGFNVYVNECTTVHFYSSIWIYALQYIFIVAYEFMHSIITAPMTSFDSNLLP